MNRPKPTHTVRLDSLPAGAKFVGPGSAQGKVVRSTLEGVEILLRRRSGGKGVQRWTWQPSTWMGGTMVSRA